MLVDRPHPVLLGHVPQGAWGEENDPGMHVADLDRGWRQLVEFDLEGNLVPAAAAFLTDSELPHEPGELFVARLRRRVDEPSWVDQRSPGVGEFDPIIKELDRRAGAALGEVLVDECVSDELPKSQWW